MSTMILLKQPLNAPSSTTGGEQRHRFFCSNIALWAISGVLACVGALRNSLLAVVIWSLNAVCTWWGYVLGAPAGSVNAFISGTEGYHTFRIPALLLLSSGELLLFCEGRRQSSRDDGWIDLVYKRSSDGGRSWHPLVILYGEGSKEESITIGNPCPAVVDGRVFVAFSRQNSQLLTLHSLDADGKVWPTKPSDISNQVLGTSRVGWVAPGPPGALQLVNGRVLVPYNTGPAVDRTAAGTFFSDDGGTTWSSSNLIQGANECQVALTVDKRLLLNMRMASSDGARLLAYSDDMGSTWGASRRWELDAVECQGSMISSSLQGASGKCSVLLFSQPAVHWIRGDLTLWLSADSGSTWQVAQRVQQGPSAYSTLQQAASGQVLIAYEVGISSAIRFSAIKVT